MSVTADSPLSDHAAPQGLSDFSSLVQHGSDGMNHLALLVDGARCGGCIQKIEGALNADPAVTGARLNLSTGRLTIAFSGEDKTANRLAEHVRKAGYRVAPFDALARDDADQSHEKHLLRAIAVSGFGAANIMLLSVAIWSGDAMADSTKALFHWISAVIAIPVVAYAGQPFFVSAWSVLKHRTTNMDVPISLAVLLATGLSLVQLLQGEAAHAWFESAVMLLFFLLIGRYFDARARSRARGAAGRLMALRATEALVLTEDGATQAKPADHVEPGERVLIRSGASAPVDGVIETGRSEFDTSLVTGETLPARAQKGDRVYAGTVNLGAPVTLEATAVREDTVLAEITRLMEAAEQRKAQLVVLADKIAKAYVPVVHATAALAFLYWFGIAGAGWSHALEIAIAVLVITCPCALALAVPAVQVLSASRLMKAGLVIKAPTALERLAKVTAVVFDKTGTLTDPELEPDLGHLTDEERDWAGRLCAISNHPLARALRHHVPQNSIDGFEASDVPGMGVELERDGVRARLGNRIYVGAPADAPAYDKGPELWLGVPGRAPVMIGFAEKLRPDAQKALEALRHHGVSLSLLSGDHQAAVARAAQTAGIEDFTAAAHPADKVAALEEMASQGAHVLMVGDGLNDAPALAAASVSLSPGTGSDIAQNAADAVFQSHSLLAVPLLLTVAKRSQMLVHQNIGFALAYNAVAVPLAMAGFITPMIAAIAMSASSLLVLGNAFRISAVKETS